jgi:hypothetical protein
MGYRDDGSGILIGLAMFLFFVGIMIYLITLIAAAAAAIAAAGGTIWGGGWAILNYGKSIKENLIDSNRNIADV